MVLNKVELFKYVPVEIAVHPGARSFTTKTAIQKNAFMGSKEACRCTDKQDKAKLGEQPIKLNSDSCKQFAVNRLQNGLHFRGAIPSVLSH